jgi:ABC-type hemin transport system ATPase subunit
MEETRRVMPYLQRDERPPRDYIGDDDFNTRAVQRFAERPYAEVETWYEQQRVALKQLVSQLPDAAFESKRVYRWLFGTIVKHYDEHPLPKRESK